MDERLTLACLALALAWSVAAELKDTNIGYFWQVTDFHFDQNYSLFGDPSKMCHATGQRGSTEPGRFGDFKCDSPWLLITSAINAMHNYQSKPDFILWTGDTAPHVPDYMLSDGTILSLLSNLSMALRETFPNTTIYPTFGNHDAHPAGDMPAANTSYYDDVLSVSGWKYFLPSGSSATFKAGGYYSHIYSKYLKILSLNTALYYINDAVTAQLPDPADQFVWLEKELQSARSNNMKVYIAAHVPPGLFEGALGVKFFQDAFNERYSAILLSYSDVIAGQFYGHAHTDSFRLISDRTDQMPGAAFLCPSVTPLSTSGRNPSIRLYSYDRGTLDVHDYVQYYFNLTAANANTAAQQPDAIPFWQEEYTFTSAYYVPDASPSSLFTLWLSFHGGKSPTFASYLRYNSVEQNVGAQCNATCVAGHICAVGHVSYDAYKLCIEQFDHKTTPSTPAGTSDVPHTTRHSHKDPAPRYMHYIIAALAGVSVVAAIAIAVYCFSQRRLRSRGALSSTGYEPL